MRWQGQQLGVDDTAALQPERALMADADDAGEVRAAAQAFEGLDRVQLGDDADDLARPDIEDREGRALTRG